MVASPRARRGGIVNYTERLVKSQDAWWKRALGVQRPYRFNVRRVCEGEVLEIGCGIGRNLGHLAGRAVGVDTDAESVAEARRRGFEAFVPDDFARTAGERALTFDTLLFAHVLEHVPGTGGRELVGSYLPFLRNTGRVVVICPQERGYASDETHVRFLDFAAIRDDLASLDLAVSTSYSFPLPRFAGRYFAYNEFVVVGAQSRPR